MYMNEYDHRYVAVAKNTQVDWTSTVTLKEHKRRYMALRKAHSQLAPTRLLCKAGATYSSGTAMAIPVFCVSSTFQF